MSYKEVYDKCNYHLVESDKKRDQLIAFYIGIVGAFLALTKGDTQIPEYFILALAFLGLLLACLIVQYRKWHIRYINSARVINHLLVHPQLKPDQAMRDLCDDINSDTGIEKPNKFFDIKFLRRYFQGVEALTYQAFLIVAYVPIHVTLIYSKVGIPLNVHWSLVFSLNLLLFLFFTNAYAFFYLYNDFRKQTPFAKWVLPKEANEFLKKKI